MDFKYSYQQSVVFLFLIFTVLSVTQNVILINYGIISAPPHYLVSVLLAFGFWLIPTHSHDSRSLGVYLILLGVEPSLELHCLLAQGPGVYQSSPGLLGTPVLFAVS